MNFVKSIYENENARRQKRTELNNFKSVLKEKVMDKAMIALEIPRDWSLADHNENKPSPPSYSVDITDLTREIFTDTHGTEHETFLSVTETMPDLPRMVFTDNLGWYHELPLGIELDKERNDRVVEIGFLHDRMNAEIDARITADDTEINIRGTEDTRLENDKQNKIGKISLTNKVLGSVDNVGNNAKGGDITISTTVNLIESDIPQLSISKVNNLQNNLNNLSYSININSGRISDLEAALAEIGDGDFVLKSGDTMTGALEIANEPGILSSPSIGDMTANHSLKIGRVTDNPVTSFKGGVLGYRTSYCGLVIQALGGVNGYGDAGTLDINPLGGAVDVHGKTSFYDRILLNNGIDVNTNDNSERLMFRTNVNSQWIGMRMYGTSGNDGKMFQFRALLGGAGQTSELDTNVGAAKGNITFSFAYKDNTPIVRFVYGDGSNWQPLVWNAAEKAFTKE